MALILLALNFHIQSCHPPLGPPSCRALCFPSFRRLVPPFYAERESEPGINPTCNCVMPSSPPSVPPCSALCLSSTLPDLFSPRIFHLFLFGATAPPPSLRGAAAHRSLRSLARDTFLLYTIFRSIWIRKCCRV